MYEVGKSKSQKVYIFSIVALENVDETYRRLLGSGMLWLDGWICKCVRLNLNHNYCNGYVCKCVWLTPHDITCHNYDAYLK